MTHGKEKVVREEAELVVGWGPNLKVVRAPSPSGSLLALCSAFFLPPGSSSNAYSLSASVCQAKLASDGEFLA